MRVAADPRRILSALIMVLLIFSDTPAVSQEDPESVVEQPDTAQKRPRSRTETILAASWQPGFCETRPKKPECSSQTADRPDAGRFSLHGLWKMRKSYCGVAEDIKALDKKSKWGDLPKVMLKAEVEAALGIAMPGVQSGLERHEWIKHGSCSGMTPDGYFQAALQLLDALNASQVGALFAARLGQSLREAEIKQAFDQAFGPGAGQRVKMRCAKDGDRRVITELTIGLTGDTTAAAGGQAGLARLIAAAGPTKFNCPEGIVDAAGFQ